MRKKLVESRGLALLLVLMMATVILMMVICLYLTSRNGVFVSLQQYRSTASLYAAEAGLAETMEYLEQNAFTTPPTDLSGKLPNGASWLVQFKDSGPDQGTFDSVNNLNNGDVYAGSYRGKNSVPPYSALIVVQANMGGAERVLEGMITRGGAASNTGYALQGVGVINMSGDVAIDGVTSLLDSTPVPGSVHSNADSGDTVTWDGSGSIDITGTVSSLGGNIDLQGYTPGGGAPTSGVSAPPPAVDVVSEISSKSGSPAPPVVPFGTTTISGGDYYYDGDLDLNGDLVLEGGKLYVTGELTVNGSITGEGSVYVGETTKFKGDARILAETGNNVSLFSRDSVTLEGFDGEAYLEALATSDPTVFGKYYGDAKATIGEMQTLLNDPTNAPADFFAGGGKNAELDTLRRTLGQTMAGTVVPGRQGNTLGLISSYLDGQPPGPTRDFLKDKFESMRRFYMPGEELEGDGPAMQYWLDQKFDRGGALDGMLDTSDMAVAADLFPDMVAYTDSIDYDRLGSSFFRGRVYTNGFIHAADQITVVGSVTADGDPALGSVTLPDGTVANPGDIVLEDGTRITFVEDLGTGSGSSPGNALTVASWIGR